MKKSFLISLLMVNLLKADQPLSEMEVRKEIINTLEEYIQHYSSLYDLFLYQEQLVKHIIECRVKLIKIIKSAQNPEKFKDLLKKIEALGTNPADILKNIALYHYLKKEYGYFDPS